MRNRSDDEAAHAAGADALVHVAAFDGLSGLAVLAVIVAHLNVQFDGPFPTGTGARFASAIAGAGWIGVDLFFVLSGFLITGILLRTRGDQYYFRNFFARRALAAVYVVGLAISQGHFSDTVTPQMARDGVASSDSVVIASLATLWRRYDPGLAAYPGLAAKLALGAVAMPATYWLAVACYVGFESRFLRLKARFASDREPDRQPGALQTARA